VADAFLHGYLACGHYHQARRFLDRWSAQASDEPYCDYLWGVCWKKLRNWDAAGERLLHALTLQPDLDSARIELAGVYETRSRLDLALRQYVELAERAPGDEIAAVGLARVLRKLGRRDEARATLAPLAAHSEVPPLVRAELGQLALDDGQYEQAEQWLTVRPVADMADLETLVGAGIVLMFREKRMEAESCLTRAVAVASREGRVYDVQVRLASVPGDRAAQEEWQRLTQTDRRRPDEQPAPTPPNQSAKTGAGLYAIHCANCHSATGDGRGPAARHLFPRPRNLRSDALRLVSTRNGAALPEDLMATIVRGMPGTSMPAFPKLTSAELAALVQFVQQVQRDGLREQLVKRWQEEDEEVAEEDVRSLVAQRLQPGERVQPPRPWPKSPPHIERGRETFLKLGCAQCHGRDGTGTTDQAWFDEQGQPLRSRDLTREPLKGGPDLESLYLRIAVGMPGTPHPASPSLSDEQLVELAEFCRSQIRTPPVTRTNDQRYTLSGVSASRPTTPKDHSL
jgi:mono/diheme cytochrome c family protein